MSGPIQGARNDFSTTVVPVARVSMADARRFPAHGRVRPVGWSRPADSPAGEWHTFEGTWTAAGTRRTLRLGPDERAAIFELTGSLLLTGAQRPAVGFRAQAIGFSDSRAGMQGRCVWTDERGDMVYSELRGEFVGTVTISWARSLAGRAVTPA